MTKFVHVGSWSTTVAGLIASEKIASERIEIAHWGCLSASFPGFVDVLGTIRRRT